MRPDTKVISLFDKDVVHIIKELTDLLGGDGFVKQRLSRDHRFYELFQFYFLNKDKDWADLQIPDSILNEVDATARFVVVLKQIILTAGNGKPLMSFFKTDYIDTLCAEAQVLSEYLLRGGYQIKWPSIFGQDPPDLVIYDVVHKIPVDVEIKVKESTGTIDSMFDSLSKGLQSLKNRKGRVDRPAVIVVHNQDDLGWVDWLKNEEVKRKLTSRLENSEYSVVSGIIFSGGAKIAPLEGARQCYTQFVSFTSLVAKYKLPPGFFAIRVM